MSLYISVISQCDLKQIYLHVMNAEESIVLYAWIRDGHFIYIQTIEIIDFHFVPLFFASKPTLQSTERALMLLFLCFQ